MSDDQIIQLSLDARVRYEVVSHVRVLQLLGWPLSEAVCEASSRSYQHADGESTLVSVRTVYRWVSAYGREGLQGLEPQERKGVDGSRVLSPKLLAFVAKQRLADRDASLPEIIKRARHKGIVQSDESLDRATLWRACHRLGIETRRRKGRRDRDSRRFNYLERMQMELADFVHFRAGALRKKRVALYFLDDATRFGLGVAVGTSEQVEIFLLTLHQVLCELGLMDALYLDRGPGFRADDTHDVLRQLGILFIHGQARYPEGHGKIERFNRSLRQRLLRTLDGSPEVDPDCGALTLRLRHDLHEVYNHTPHEGLGGDTPWTRWTASRPLRPVRSQDWLTRCFTLTEQRRVSNDNVIRFEGTDYEIPRGHAGEWITVYRRILEQGALYVLHDGRLVRLHPPDTYLNARSRRARQQSEPEPGESEATPHTSSSSTMAFDKVYGTVLDTDGGCSPNEDETTNDFNE